MNLITPFEFIGRHKDNRSAIIVGNANSLGGEGLGKWIDGHDIVVRFNECAISGFEEDVGSKTDILVTNPYVEARNRPLLDNRLPGTVLVIASQTRRGNLESFFRWAGNSDVLFTYSPDLVGIKNSDHDAGLTTGTYALQLLSRTLLPSQLSCTGFTMFLGATGHYWQQSLPPGLAAHDVICEARIFLSILNRCVCPVTITEEIAWVARQVDVKPGKRVTVLKLNNPRWRGEA